MIENIVWDKQAIIRVKSLTGFLRDEKSQNACQKSLKLMRKIFFFCNYIRINGDLHRNMYFFKGALHSTKQLYYALLNSKLIRLLFLQAEQLCTTVTRFPVDFQVRCKFSTCVTFILGLLF